MTVAGEGRNPTRSHMLRLAEQSNVPKREADGIIEQVRAAVQRWEAYAAEAGVSTVSMQQIAKNVYENIYTTHGSSRRIIRCVIAR